MKDIVLYSLGFKLLPSLIFYAMFDYWFYSKY
jgi:hypothetical protein